MSVNPSGLGPEDAASQRDAAALLAQIRDRVNRLEERDNPDPPNAYRIVSETVTAEDTVEVTLS